MVPVETAQELGERGGKRAAERMNSNMIYLLNCKDFCTYSNVPLSNTIVV
jgi:hypothetical protein